MLQIRPVSDLYSNFTEIEQTVAVGGPVFLTKNGYGSMVVMSLDYYSAITDNIEKLLDEADQMALESDIRYTHDDIFTRIRSRVSE